MLSQVVTICACAVRLIELFACELVFLGEGCSQRGLGVVLYVSKGLKVNGEGVMHVGDLKVG